MRRKAEGSTPSPPNASPRSRSVRLSEGRQPLELERRVQLPHGPLFDAPGGGTGRRAGLRRTCPRGVGVRISPRRLDLLQAGRCPAGPHKSGVPGSIPGPGTAGGPVLCRVSYARRRRSDSPTRNCSVFLNRWHGTLTGIAATTTLRAVPGAWCLWVRIPPVLLTAIRPVVQRPGRLSYTQDGAGSSPAGTTPRKLVCRCSGSTPPR